jgi:hypothetical protein
LESPGPALGPNSTFHRRRPVSFLRVMDAKHKLDGGTYPDVGRPLPGDRVRRSRLPCSQHRFGHSPRLLNTVATHVRQIQLHDLRRPCFDCKPCLLGAAALAKRTGPWPYWAELICSGITVTVSYGVAALSWKYYENPILQLKRRFGGLAGPLHEGAVSADVVRNHAAVRSPPVSRSACRH